VAGAARPAGPRAALLGVAAGLGIALKPRHPEPQGIAR